MCYLPPLRDAERALRSGRGSRLSRLIANLSEEKLKEIRDRSELMPLEETSMILILPFRKRKKLYMLKT